MYHCYLLTFAGHQSNSNRQLNSNLFGGCGYFQLVALWCGCHILPKCVVFSPFGGAPAGYVPVAIDDLLLCYECNHGLLLGDSYVWLHTVLILFAMLCPLGSLYSVV